MNSQCPRCLSSMFAPVMKADSVPAGYRLLGKPRVHQAACDFCEPLDVEKRGSGWTNQITTRVKPELRAV